MADDTSFTQEQLFILVVVQRAASSVSFLSATYIVVMAFRNRHRVYHRLMLGMACHMIVFSVCELISTAAMPETYNDEESDEYSHYSWRPKGTIQTCEAQGFLIQFSGISFFLYYAFLSLYSFLAVRHNFQVTKRLD